MKGVVIDEAALVMAGNDDVATALEDLDAGRELPIAGAGRADAESVTVLEDVPFGHKVALVALEQGDPVHKYGEVIGRATGRIEAGEWVHTHNCESTRGRGDLAGEDGGARTDGGVHPRGLPGSDGGVHRRRPGGTDPVDGRVERSDGAADAPHGRGER